VNRAGIAVEDKPGYGRLRRRRNVLLVIVALAVIASAGGLLLSTSLKSPSQQAAETKAPGLTRLTVPVQRTVIRNTVQASGVVSKPPLISSLDSSGGGGSSATIPGNPGGNVQRIVTKIYLPPGNFVQPGSVIIEVAGRPFFVFPGTVPAYRDLAPGESGNDVAQLQAGLAEIGYSIGGDTSGTYGPGTAAAVAAYYHAIGYQVPAVQAGPKQDRGAAVPLSEIMFVPHFPAQVVKLGGSVGSVVNGSLVTLSLGSPAIRGQLNPAFGSLVRAGMHVTVTTQGSAAVVHGVITSVTRRAKTAKSISGGLYYPMGIKPRKPLPGSMGPGQDVILSIHAAQSSGPMLAVPEAAVFGGQDGRAYVSKVTGPTSAARVQVRILTQGDGLVGVSPVTPGSLKQGDQVVTGQNYLTSPGRASLRGGSTGGGFSIPFRSSGGGAVVVPAEP
jgi:peptidoglycan hydrolase-like protein with peptidoglycan-binding domain